MAHVDLRLVSGKPVELDRPIGTTIADARRQIANELKVPLHSLRLVTNFGVQPNDDDRLDVTIAPGTSFTIVIDPSFDIELVDISGPNTPRFGCTTRVVYELTCTCGHKETINESQGYVMDLPLREISKCPGCGAEPCEKLKAKDYPGANVKRQMCSTCPAMERRQEQARAAEEETWRRIVEKHEDQEAHREKLRELKSDMAFQEKHRITLVEAVFPAEGCKYGIRGFPSFPLADVWTQGSIDECPTSYGLLKLRINQCTPPENRQVEIAGDTDDRCLRVGLGRAERRSKEKARASAALLAASSNMTAQKKSGKR